MTILVGYDGTPAAAAAIEEAASVAKRREAPLIVARYVGHDPGDSPTRVRHELADGQGIAAELDAIAARLTGEGVDARAELLHGLHGRAADGLLDLAEAYAVELIVLGLHPRSRVEKLVLGSVLRDVLTRARCPVLSVKADHGGDG